MYAKKIDQYLSELKISLSIIMKFYVIIFVGSMVLFFFGRLVSDIVSTIFSVSEIKNLPSSTNAILKYGKINAFFILVLKAPLIEEIAFRYWLAHNKKKYIVSALSLFLDILTYIFNIFFIVSVFINSILLIIFNLILFFIFDDKSKMVPNTCSKCLIVMSGVLFGLSHLINYNLEEYVWFICLPYILPQIFSGVIFGYLRTKYGFWYSVSAHSLLNFTAFLAALV